MDDENIPYDAVSRGDSEVEALKNQVENMANMIQLLSESLAKTQLQIELLKTANEQDKKYTHIEAEFEKSQESNRKMNDKLVSLENELIALKALLLKRHKHKRNVKTKTKPTFLSYLSCIEALWKQDKKENYQPKASKSLDKQNEAKEPKRNSSPEPNLKQTITSSFPLDEAGEKRIEWRGSSFDEHNYLVLGAQPQVDQFLNSFDFYIRYPTPHEARTAEPLYETPLKTTDKHGNVHTIEWERHFGPKTSDSALKCHEFLLKNQLIRLINGGGYGYNDTKPQNNTKILDDIMAFITYFKKLDTIIFVTSSNGSQLPASFKASFNELLDHFEHNAVENMQFVITDSAVVDVLNARKEVDKLHSAMVNWRGKQLWQYHKCNVYIISDQGFRYVMARRMGLNLHPSAKVRAGSSWKRSAQQCQRLRECCRGLFNLYESSGFDVANFAGKIGAVLSDILQVLQFNIEQFGSSCGGFSQKDVADSSVVNFGSPEELVEQFSEMSERVFASAEGYLEQLVEERDFIGEKLREISGFDDVCDGDRFAVQYIKSQLFRLPICGKAIEKYCDQDFCVEKLIA